MIVNLSGDGVMSLNGDRGGSSAHDAAVSAMVSASGDGGGGGNEDGNGGVLMASSTWQFSIVRMVEDGGCAALRDGIVIIGVFLR